MIRGIGLGCLVSCNLQKDVCRRVVNPTERVVKQIFFFWGGGALHVAILPANMFLLILTIYTWG